MTTINTHKGVYEYTRLPFGINTAVALFQRTMETLLKGFKGVSCYLDDILVTGSTLEEHKQNLKAVLSCLSHNGFRLKKDKCHFYAKCRVSRISNICRWHLPYRREGQSNPGFTVSTECF